MSRTDAAPHAAPAPRWATAVWLAGPVLVVAGMFWHGLWSELPWERFALSLGLAGASGLLACPLVRWRQWSWSSALAVVWCAALVLYAGPVPALATTLLVAASLALGLRWTPDTLPSRVAVAAVSGYAVLTGAAGWVLSAPVHAPAVWAVLLGGSIVINRRPLVAELRNSHAAWRVVDAAHPRGLSAVVVLLGLASTGAWLPTMQADDLTYHLNLPAQLVQHGRYLADPAFSAWAFAPWMGDVGQGIAWLLGGQEARGAVNFGWLVAAAVGLAGCMQALGAVQAERLAGVALFASFPPLAWLTAGMQTELPAMAVLFALVALVLHDRQGRHLAAATILFAALAALKPMHALAALPVLAHCALRSDARLLLRRVPLMVALFLGIAGSSYAQAWWHTGNPVFPLFNATFESPDYPLENMTDTRWLSGFGPGLPWRMTFDTSHFLEAWNGGIGFLWIGLAGAWLLALRRRGTRVLALVALCVAVLPLIPIQYARYAFPGLVLLIVPALTGSLGEVGRRRLWIAPIVLLCMFNLAFQANSGWTHHSAALKRAIRAPGDPAAVLPYYVAERTLLRGLPPDPGMVLATDPARGFVAELGGNGRLMSVHAPVLSIAREAADLDATGVAWRAIFDDLDVRWLLVSEAAASLALVRALQDDPGVRHVRSLNGVALWAREAR
ncbi:hypothetical protein [Luteimonas deserti]|uniref:Glycosyltransferase RgtA/B/C/D-like domain-containing protein n=1 Tax=Luteimonas deserti TaxID=2752306 RepID=A0A7Z0QRK6_9GAMM|nr:hypothetical protein [Luteimonas deserti]NYZ63551.1 hypothetical protein [Luteimonas deserti]